MSELPLPTLKKMLASSLLKGWELQFDTITQAVEIATGEETPPDILTDLRSIIKRIENSLLD